jgi:hypothetical protein
MDSQADHMSVTQPETQVESDQGALALDDDPVLTEDKAELAPSFAEPVVTSRDPGIGETGDTAVAEVDTAAADKAAAESAAADKAATDSAVADKAAADKVAAVSAAVDSAADNAAAEKAIANVAVAVVSSAVNANVEGVRRGGKAPEMLGDEQLDVEAPTDSGMLYIRVSINVSLPSLLTHVCCVSQKKSQLMSVK